MNVKVPDKSLTKNSINGEVKKVRNSRHVNRQFWRVIFVTFGDAILDEYYLSTRKPSYRWQTRATRKPAKIAPIRRAYNVVADNTGLSSFV